VSIVAARVHDPRPRRPVLHVVFFLDRQRIHVGAQHHGATGVRAAKYSDDSGPPHACPDFEAEAAESFRDERGRFVFLEA
jgi:hypothetical protein